MVKNLYKALLILSKEKQIPIIHLKKIDEDGGMGCYLSDKKKIHMRKNLKNTLQGVYVLAHEMGHAIDHKLGRHKKFFSSEFEEKVVFNKTNWKIAKNAEISASRRGLRILKENGGFAGKKRTNSVLDIVFYPEESYSLEFFEKWKKEYFLKV